MPLLQSNYYSEQLLPKRGNYITAETDPIFTASPAYGISSEDIIAWNNKENKILIETSLPVGDLSLNTYYALSTALTGSTTITLPTVTDTTHINSIMLQFDTDSGFTDLTITPPTGVAISYYDGYWLEASKSYELNIMFNGIKWIVAYAVVV